MVYAVNPFHHHHQQEHLWRPVAAAVSNKEPNPAIIISSSPFRQSSYSLPTAEPKNTPILSSPLAPQFERYPPAPAAIVTDTINTLLQTITASSSGGSSSSSESNDVWYPIMFQENSSLYFDKLDPLYTLKTSSNFSWRGGNFTTIFDGGFGSNGGGVNSTNNIDATIQLVTMVVTAILLGIVILATVIGNVFVIAAILLERNLQNVANYLILSLAVADLLVACLVMPLGAVYEVSKEWTLGPELCDMWTSSDVLCCTASILHLVAIALDRYWAVTNIDYIHQRTSKRIGIMIFIIWFVSFLVCIAPLLGWKDPDWNERIRHKKCMISQDLYYQIFASASSFYLPLLVILILYWRIFQTARKRIRRRQIMSGAQQAATKNLAAGGIAGGLAAASGTGGIAAAVVTVIGRPLPTISETTTAFTNVSSNNSSPEKTSFANGLEADMPTTTDCSVTYQPQHYTIKRKHRDGVDSKRERKAAKTLAIITGAFVLCWLPFFIMAVLLPINEKWFEQYLISIFLWLGYFNSTLNPIIYTIFSPEFRHAFKKILCGRNYARRNKHFGIKQFQ